MTGVVYGSISGLSKDAELYVDGATEISVEAKVMTVKLHCSDSDCTR